jgi:thiamine-monophosphate kinase
MSPLPTMLPPWPHADTATVADIGEHGLIRWIRDAVATRRAPADVLIGIGDDAAVVQPRPNHVDVLTTDIQVEGVHFAWHLSTPAEIGARALHVNLSDLAAMGAEPRVALLSLGLPPAMPGLRLHALLGGFLEAAARAGVAVVGGNISQAPAVMLDVTASGAVKRRAILRRGGARAGDEIYVSGQVGAAAAGLAWLERHPGAAQADVPDEVADAARRTRGWPSACRWHATGPPRPAWTRATGWQTPCSRWRQPAAWGCASSRRSCPSAPPLLLRAR